MKRERRNARALARERVRPHDPRGHRLTGAGHAVRRGREKAGLDREPAQKSWIAGHGRGPTMRLHQGHQLLGEENVAEIVHGPIAIDTEWRRLRFEVHTAGRVHEAVEVLV